MSRLVSAFLKLSKDLFSLVALGKLFQTLHDRYMNDFLNLTYLNFGKSSLKWFLVDLDWDFLIRFLSTDGDWSLYILYVLHSIFGD